MRKISFLLIVTILSFALGQISYSSTRQCFVVTAYYSPLPNQSYYSTGNYYSEVILNGQGIAGASGRKVFAGMLAAPQSYPFGTKIQLDGIGIGDVQDRGGAIVPAGQRGYECDRIDIWTGDGEVGLAKALYWGKRKVYGSVISSSSKSTINLANFKQANIVKNTNTDSQIVLNIYQKSVGKESSKEDIKKVQEELKNIGIYSGEINGIYNSEVISAISRIQQEYKLVGENEIASLGYWGPKTRSKILEIKNSGKKYNIPVENKVLAIATKVSDEENNDNFSAKNLTKDDSASSAEGQSMDSEKIETNSEIENIGNDDNLSAKNLAKNDSVQSVEGQSIVSKTEKTSQIVFDKNVNNSSEIEDVKWLQEKFFGLHLYNGEIDGDFAKIEEIIKLYQLQEGIIASLDEIGAGYFGPKTKESLEVATEKLTEKSEIKKEHLAVKEEKEKLKSEIIEKTGNLSKVAFGQTSSDVRELQKTLAKLGFFDVKDTAYFGEVTKQSLIKYQEAKGIEGNGIMGDETLNFLRADLAKMEVSNSVEKV